MGFAAIGNEIENPFGHAVNDLPLEIYCAQIASDVNIIAARAPAKPTNYSTHPDNKPLYPISSVDSRCWYGIDEGEVREALRTRASLSKPAMWRRQSVGVTSGPHSWGGSVDGSTLG